MPAARKRRRTKRCAYIDDQGRRCRRVGFGQAQLCRHHAVLIEQELEDDDPISLLFEKLDRVIAQRFRGRPVEAATSMLVDELDRRTRARRQAFIAMATGAAYNYARRVASAPPPRAPSPSPPPSRDPAELRARDILGFAPNQSITRAEIQQRRRELARRHHPDRSRGDAISSSRMKNINEAADRLLQTLA